ncbi:DNA polymerase III subunit delta [Klenkia terrae]|uniref:DNA polymerase III subunit delta n=1 Tax=Klenkia terrae TaxID=1052259 RepID=UPI0036176771
MPPTAAPPPPLSRLRLVVGEEELLRARAVSEVRAAVRRMDPDSEEHELAALGLPVGQLADVLAPSLFGGHRLVVVTGVHEAAGALVDSLLSYAKDPDPELTLVLVHSGGKRNEALLKAFRQAGAAEDECPKLVSAGDRMTFVRNEVRRVGGKITPMPPPRCSRRSATTCAPCRRRPASWSRTSAARSTPTRSRGSTAGRPRSPASPSPSGCSSGTTRGPSRCCGGHWTGVPHVLLADAIADGVRTAARVASLGTTNIGDLARQLKMPPWKVKKAQAQSRGWTIPALQQAIGVAAELNADVKGVAASADYALERAVRRIVELRTAAGGGRGGRSTSRY